jgi:protein tyrosine phosphatase
MNNSNDQYIITINQIILPLAIAFSTILFIRKIYKNKKKYTLFPNSNATKIFEPQYTHKHRGSIYQGDLNDCHYALNIKSKQNICIVNLSESPDTPKYNDFYLRCDIPDWDGHDIQELNIKAYFDIFDKVRKIVPQWLNQGRDVLVNCFAGRNRSGMIIAIILLVQKADYKIPIQNDIQETLGLLPFNKIDYEINNVINYIRKKRPQSLQNNRLIPIITQWTRDRLSIQEKITLNSTSPPKCILCKKIKPLCRCSKFK